MEFDKSKVYTALNADELKVGSKVIVGDNLSELKEDVLKHRLSKTIKAVKSEDNEHRFMCDDGFHYALVYLVSEPELNWIAYLCRRDGVEPSKLYLTCCRSDKWEFVKEGYGAKTKLFEGTEDEAEEWYTARRQLADVIAAWEDGKTIQYNSGNGWEDCCDNKPAWDVNSEYRIKPESLKWTDLKIGDIVHRIDTDAPYEAMVVTIDKDPATSFHIMIGNNWTTNEELEDWEKVE